MNTINNIYRAAKEELEAIVREALGAAIEKGELPEAEIGKISVEVPKDTKNGDLSCTAALALAKPMRCAPRKIADAIVAGMRQHPWFESYSVAGAGFINAVFGCGWYSDVLRSVTALGDNYGGDDIGHGETVMVEFVSANPTGPMHRGNARGGVFGDSLAAVLERAGYKVWREFYVNDAGNQVDLFGKSIEARYIQHLKGEDAVEFPDNGYHGDDIKELAALITGEFGDSLLELDPEDRRVKMREIGLARNLERMQADLKRYNVVYDCWFRETSLHNSGFVKETIDMLGERGYLYEKDGAVWFKGTELGMEKDEVMVKANGFYTYYAVDIAYHRNKLMIRNFDRVIDVLGADHHGHAVRFRAALTALGIDPTRLDIKLYQLVNLLQNGEAVRMSKRTGKMISLDNLLDEISVDAARFIFNSKQSDTHLEFDLGVAVREDSENPVYYVQYAHARICSMLDRLAAEGLSACGTDSEDLALLTEASERALIKQIASLPDEVRLAARDYEPYRMTKYLIDLATAFHSFYTDCRIKGADEKLAAARLTLADTTRSVIANVLGMLKISAPARMEKND
ncbi:MAG: arginine--tRNA ligase [Oscillospiraceae bacterium]|nr:arginine--tRNA ligase [Oscillospiraceae bacterium]